MTLRIVLSGVGLAATMAVTSATAQHEQHLAGAQTGIPAAQVTQCARAQPVVAKLVEASLKRLEDARLTNDPAAMRDAADDLQSALVDIRTQLGPCAAMQAAADAHAGHVTPNVGQSPAAAPATPAMQPGSPAPAPGAVRPAAPAPAAGDAHAGHAVPASPQGPAPRAPAASAARPSPRSPSASAARPAPPASHDGNVHAGHAAPAAAGQREGSSAPGQARVAAPPTNFAELKCPNAVDPKTGPRMLYQGRMYYFCSEARRAEFAKDPSKFVTASPQAAPAHAH